MEYLTIEEIKEELKDIEFLLEGDEDNHISNNLANNLKKYNNIKNVEKEINVSNVLDEKTIKTLKKILNEEEIK